MSRRLNFLVCGGGESGNLWYAGTRSDGKPLWVLNAKDARKFNEKDAGYVAEKCGGRVEKRP